MSLGTLERPTNTTNTTRAASYQAIYGGLQIVGKVEKTPMDIGGEKPTPEIIKIGEQLEKAAEKADEKNKPQASTLAVPGPNQKPGSPRPTPSQVPVGAPGRIYNSGTSTQNPANKPSPTQPHPSHKNLPQKPRK
jgi:hypothetical protein